MRSSFPLSLRSSFAIAGLLLLAQREGAQAETGACSPATILIARDFRSRHFGDDTAAGGRRPPRTLHRPRRGQRPDRRRRQALCDRLRAAPAGRLERAVPASDERRQRRRGVARDRGSAEGARIGRRAGAGARFRRAVVGQRPLGRGSGQCVARPRRRSGLRPRSAGQTRLRLRRRPDAGADRQGDDRRSLRAQAGPRLYLRLLERRAPYDGGGGADAGGLRRLPGRRSRLRSAAGGDPARLGRAGLRQGRRRHPPVDHQGRRRARFAQDHSGLRQARRARGRADRQSRRLPEGLRLRQPDLRPRRQRRLPARGQGRGAEGELRRPEKFEGRGALFQLAGRRRRRRGQLADVEDRESDCALEPLSDHRDDGRGFARLYLHHAADPGSRHERGADEGAHGFQLRHRCAEDLRQDRRLSGIRRWTS